MPRTKLYAPLEVTLFWSDGVKETVPLVYTGCYGVNRDVLFTKGDRPLAVKLHKLSTKTGQDWVPNMNEWNMARNLQASIPEVYGCFNVKIGDTPCSALVV